MFRIAIAAALLVFAPTTVAAASPSCAGADLAIVSVAVKGMTTDNKLNRYELSATVTNVGSASQASGAMQFVDIYKASEKLDSKGIPPLKSGESYTFSYVSLRSSDAGIGTTRLAFQLDPGQSSLENCHGGVDRQSVAF